MNIMVYNISYQSVSGCSTILHTHQYLQKQPISEWGNQSIEGDEGLPSHHLGAGAPLPRCKIEII